MTRNQAIAVLRGAAEDLARQLPADAAVQFVAIEVKRA